MGYGHLNPNPHLRVANPSPVGAVSLFWWRDLSGRGTTRVDDAQGTPTQSHISPIILVYKDNRCENRFIRETVSRANPQLSTRSIPAGNGHLTPSRPRLVPARPKVCTRQRTLNPKLQAVVERLVESFTGKGGGGDGYAQHALEHEQRVHAPPPSERRWNNLKP